MKKNLLWDAFSSVCCEPPNYSAARKGAEIRKLKELENATDEADLAQLMVSCGEWWAATQNRVPNPGELVSKWPEFKASLSKDTQNESRKEVTKLEVLKDLFAAFGKPTAAQLGRYKEHLEWVPDEILREACKVAIHSSEWLPSIAAIGDIALVLIKKCSDPMVILRLAQDGGQLTPFERKLYNSWLALCPDRAQLFTIFYKEQITREKISYIKKLQDANKG